MEYIVGIYHQYKGHSHNAWRYITGILLVYYSPFAHLLMRSIHWCVCVILAKPCACISKTLHGCLWLWCNVTLYVVLCILINVFQDDSQDDSQDVPMGYRKKDSVYRYVCVLGVRYSGWYVVRWYPNPVANVCMYVCSDMYVAMYVVICIQMHVLMCIWWYVVPSHLLSYWCADVYVRCCVCRWFARLLLEGHVLPSMRMVFRKSNMSIPLQHITDRQPSAKVNARLCRCCYV